MIFLSAFVCIPFLITNYWLFLSQCSLLTPTPPSLKPLEDLWFSDVFFFGGGGGRWESKGNVGKKRVNLLYWIYSIMCHIMYQNDLRNISQQNIYLLKVNNRSTRKRREKCWTSTIKTPEWCHCLRPGIFILLTLNVFHALLLSAFVIFNQENVCWDCFWIFY